MLNRSPRSLPDYVELRCCTNFTFLRGASHPDELVRRAAELGYQGLAITDECSMAGVVRAHVAAKAAGLPLLLGYQQQAQGQHRQKRTKQHTQFARIKLQRQMRQQPGSQHRRQTNRQRGSPAQRMPLLITPPAEQQIGHHQRQSRALRQRLLHAKTQRQQRHRDNAAANPEQAADKTEAGPDGDKQ